MAATTTHLKFQNQPIKIKRRRCRETTITTTTSSSTSRNIDLPIDFSPDNSWSCSPANPPPQLQGEATESLVASPLLSSSPSDLKIRYSPSAMGSTTITTTVYRGGTPTHASAAAQDGFPSSFSKFNSALTAGLLNPMSPPPSVDKTRSSPTLFEMMANEPDCHPRATTFVENGAVSAQNYQNSKMPVNPPSQDKQALMQQRLMDLLALRSPGNQFNDEGSSDVKLTLSSKEGVSVSISVHRQILVAHSRFFALKLNEKWVKQQRSSGPYIVEIADCDDIEVYVETLRLMYCKDLRKKLMKEDVSRVLGILKVSAAIGFDAGVLSCLEYLEAAPWAEDEEEKVASLLSELRLEGVGAAEVLKRVSLDATAGIEDGNGNEEVLLKLLQVVLEGKDEKARRDMKGLVTKMLRENSSHNDLRKESLYFACDGCLKLLRRHFLQAAEADMHDVGQIARQADNLHWLLDILIDRQIAEDFLKIWSSQSELAQAHSKVPAIHRYEISRVTARLFVGIGKRQLLASKEARCMLLQTWLVPFYEDFGWMRRASRGLDRHLIEDGLSNTISTLPMAWQQEILTSWFDRFLNSGDDCPNIQRGFEVWWRRAFWRRSGQLERPQMRIITDTTTGNS
ncbi:BTB/POZ domain-containing protein [Sesamum alatum]|uniref:BTB/POZ domain-containing protein n=1 Tax=Sesamum alatum TaxID=300844 RepID=A0AAE1Y3J0_9LAMI|nr:BTB/POZ domain-containing protein [Sesamum alatum]